VVFLADGGGNGGKTPKGMPQTRKWIPQKIPRFTGNPGTGRAVTINFFKKNPEEKYFEK